VDHIFNAWVAAGNEPYLLIEPVDGFHPSQVFHSLFADWYYEELEEDHPDWLGAINPNNALIEQIFGNQGGYGNWSAEIDAIMEATKIVSGGGI